MEQENFSDYLKYFKGLELKDKQAIVIQQLKLLVSLTDKMCDQVDVKTKINGLEELVDLKHRKYSEDDYTEAILVLINSIQESLCDFDLRLTQILSNNN